MDKNLQKAILSSIEHIIDNTDENVSYEVYTIVEKSGWGLSGNKNTTIKHHIDIVITDAVIDTRPRRTKLT